jgi:calmodulin
MKKVDETKEPHLAPLTDEEMEAVTVVFHQFETGLREGTIYTKDLLSAMKALGLSPTEQEVVDMQCEVERKGRIFFPDFSRLCLRKFREFNEEHFRQELFKNICGTEPHPKRFRAKKYKISEKYFSRVDFEYMMSRLPVYVSEQDIEEMFTVADRDKDGKISYQEFLTMITPRPADPGTNANNIKLNMTISGHAKPVTSDGLKMDTELIITDHLENNTDNAAKLNIDADNDEKLVEPLLATTKASE